MYEAAPMVIGEANILGTPVLSTKTLSSTEQISDGVTGVICENSEEGLLVSLKKILENTELLEVYKENVKGLQQNNEKQKLELQGFLGKE